MTESDKNSTNHESNSSLLGVLGTISLFLSALTAYVFFYINTTTPFTDNFKDAGALFNDIASPLITLCALIGLVITIKLQKNELKDTRAELKKQNAYIAKQNFENTFFQMLNLWSNATQSLTISNTDFKGKELFSRFYSNHINLLYPPFTRDEYDLKYNDEWNKFNSFCGSYMIMLQEILTYIDSSDLSQTEKQNYVNIIFAQCNSIERLYIFFFGLSTTHGQRLKHLVEKYSGMKYLDIENIKNKISASADYTVETILMSFIEQYEITAYADNLGALKYHKDYIPPSAEQ